jgi:LEA14-like dessication related protein
MRLRGLAAAAALLASCSALPPRVAVPEVGIAGVRVVEARLPQVRLWIDLAVKNPNAVAIDLASLEADLAIEGEAVAKLRLPAPVVLPPERTTHVALAASADAGAALAGLGHSLGSARPLAYDLGGRATLADGTTFPFRRRGEIPTSPTRR